MKSFTDIPLDLEQQEQLLLRQLAEKQALREHQLIELVEINSGSLNPAGINQTGERCAHWFAPISDSCERLPLPHWQRMDFSGEIIEQPLGDLWRFRRRPDAPCQILLCGHTDTVFPPESPFQHAIRLDHARLNAPGAADMKGGILVILSALEALEAHPLGTEVGWTLLLNPDEEIGSPGSADLLASEAGRHHLGLIYEPALPDGNLAGQRKGSGNFTLCVRGRAAHAGRNPEQGRNAINKAAELALELQNMNQARPGLTLNNGMIRGGETTNKVPDLAVLKFNIRIENKADADWCQQQLQGMILRHNHDEGFNLALHGGFGRLPKNLDAQHLALYKLVQNCAKDLGQDLNWQATGGCCDGNNLSAAGLANIDTLGVTGNFIHSTDEFIYLDSLTERARLSALLLFRIAANGLPFTPASRSGEIP
ncbi:hydrolase [Neptuniibacter halophilus]|uniref:hydrolase n=1 Tax=Neptuniibacter halophilus TaxID=651666 RepID=UPI0025748F88|nr:hydrolase [Neptuniibacter halophilus]